MSTFAADSPVGKFPIVIRGESKAAIVVTSERPGDPLEFAARELQRYVREISGAELPIGRAASNLPAIELIVRPVEVASLPRTNGIKAPDRGDQRRALEDTRGRDRYRLKVEATNVLIEGASPRAVLFGVYDLLERLGCGWCVPGDDTIPRRDTLELAPLQVDAQPAFSDRMMLDFPMLTVAQTLAIADWIAKNRMNWIHECPNAHGEPTAWYERRERIVPELTKRGLGLLVGGHTMHTWLPETNFTAHPDWFAWVASSRQPPTLCVSQPEMTSVLITNLLRFLDRCPEVDAVDLWHTDDEVFCHCPKCTRGVVRDSTPDATTTPPGDAGDAVRSAYVISYVEFVNRIAAAVAVRHPRVLLSPLIYSQTDRAMPDECPPLAENVLLGLAHFYRDSYRPLIGEPKSAVNLRFLGNDLTWMAKAKHSYVYEYYNSWTAPYLYPGAQLIVRDLQTLQALQVQGISSDMYGYSPINMYVAARALWSPALDWKEAVRDFCLRYYGDAGAEMAENEIRLNNGIFGLGGYQANGARDPESATRPASGRYLEQQRDAQIKFLTGLISRTTSPQVRVRLERALKPWSLWNKEPRFWAFPDFSDPKDALILDSTKQLFLDDALIATMTRVTRTVEPARKFAGNPVLWPTEQWEPPKAVIYGSVIRDQEKFRMWYQSGQGVGYAESDDGIRWSKPRLDLTLINGERSNVLFTKKGIMEGPDAFPYFHEIFGVHRDEREPDPARRYKMGFLEIDWKYEGPDGLPWRKNQRRGMGVAGSPDGIHWKLIDSWATSAIVDGATHWMFDPVRTNYVLYGRMLKTRPEVVAVWQTNTWFKQWFSGRAVARLESTNFATWDYIKPGTAPIVMTADLEDPPGTEIYSMKVFPYEGLYLGLVQVFHATPSEGTLDVQLAVSRDSIHFTRVGNRATFLPIGAVGSWDRFNLSLANNDPIVVGDELRFYYSGRLYRHTPYDGPDKGEEKAGIGFAAVRRDRFVALESSFDGGEIITRPLQLRGTTLHLNAKSDFGEIQVDLLAADGAVLARSKPIQRDALDIAVEWTGAVQSPAGPVSLRLRLKNARLFALWCSP